MVSRKARNPFVDSPSRSPSPKKPAAPNPVPASPQQTPSDNGGLFGFKRFFGNLLGSTSTPAPVAPRQGTQNNPFVISPSPEPVTRPESEQSFVVVTPPPPPSSHEPHGQPVKLSRSPELVPQVVAHSPSPVVLEQPAVFLAPSRPSVPAPVLLPSLQHTSPSQPLQLSSQVASLAQAPASVPRRARNPFAYSPSPPPTVSVLNQDSAQDHGVQHVVPRQESRSSSVATEFGYDDALWVFPPPAIRRGNVAEDDYESPLFVPDRRKGAPIIILDDDEDGKVVKEEAASNAELNSRSVGPASQKHSSLAGDGDSKPAAENAPSGSVPCATEKKAQDVDKHQHQTDGFGLAKSRSDAKSQLPKEESSLIIPGKSKNFSVMVIHSNDEGDTPKGNTSKTDLISRPVNSAIDKHSDTAANESSKKLDGELLTPAVEDGQLLTRSNESEAPLVGETDTFLPPPACLHSAEPTGLDDDVSPLCLDAVVDQAEVGSTAGRSRSRSVETDPSLFGSPAREDELVVNPEADAQLPAEQPSNEQPSAHDSEVDHADAMSTSGVSSTRSYDHIGVRWVTGEFDHFNPYPQWSCQPEEHEVVELLQEVVSPLEEYKVTSLHKSAYNAFFTVAWADKSYVLKLTVPVCPERKTLSEVATMRWTKMMTPLPLPDVVQNLYSTSANNPVGCEWILMRKVPGRSLFDCWFELDMSRKRRIVEQLAEYTICVFDNHFDGISSLYPASSGDPDKRPEMSGMDSTMPFFWNGRYEKNRPCGPYETYREWAFHRLDLAYADAGKVLPRLQHRRMRLIPWRIQALINKLKELHDVLFLSSPITAPNVKQEEKEEEKDQPLKGTTKDEPIDLSSDSEDDATLSNSSNTNNDDDHHNSNVMEPEPFICEERTMMWHTNLSADNIFVDDTGVITGVLDWECISAIPRSVACQLPALLLEGHDRFEEPRVEHYWTFSDTLSHHPSSGEDEEDEDDEEDEEERGRSRPRKRRRRVGPTSEYWQARREYELTQLRHHFERYMYERSLGWHMCHKHHALKMDFEAAVQYCDDPLLLGVVEEWVGAVEKALGEKKKNKTRGLEVWCLERRIARGHRAPAGHNER